MLKNGFRYYTKTYHKFRKYIRIAIGREVYFPIGVKLKKEFHGNYQAQWCVASDSLSEKSIIYSFGVGTDISFDLSLIKRYGCRVFAFDPTPRSITWINNQKLPSKFTFLDYGVSGKDGAAIFYPPCNPNHVSFSAYRPSTNDTGVVLSVYKLSSIMKSLGHDEIDLLKMDIEGSEYDVLGDLFAFDMNVKQLLVEFHHRYDGNLVKKTRDTIVALQRAGFKIFFISPNGEEYAFIK